MSWFARALRPGQGERTGCVVNIRLVSVQWVLSGCIVPSPGCGAFHAGYELADAAAEDVAVALFSGTLSGNSATTRRRPLRVMPGKAEAVVAKRPNTRAECMMKGQIGMVRCDIVGRKQL